MAPFDPVSQGGQRVLLIGLDAADWGVIDPLIDAGRMPHLAALIARGQRGSLAAEAPLLSPVLWTSIATGRRPHRHGVHGHWQPWRNGRGVSPVSSLARDCDALWDVLARDTRPRRCHVVAWPVTHPAEAAGGVMVSDRFALRAAYRIPPAGVDDPAVEPPKMRAVFEALAIGPQQVDPGILRQFVPAMTEADVAQDPRIGSIAAVLAEAETICAVAERALADGPDWDLAAVFFPGLERLSRLFMPFHPPRRESVAHDEFDRYREVVARGYERHDALLGRLVARAGAGAAVVIISDHGFYHDERRPAGSTAAAGATHEAVAAAWHRPQGIAVVSGYAPTLHVRVPPDATIYDVAPSVFALTGVPWARGKSEGRSWVSAPAAAGGGESAQPPSAPATSRARGRSGQLWRDPDERASDDAVRHLLALGYAETPDPDAERAVDHCRQVNAANLARALIEAGLYDDARALMESWLKRRPGEPAMKGLLTEVLRRWDLEQRQSRPDGRDDAS